jgi:tetratricopeptide (TPR) repeat protein
MAAEVNLREELANAQRALDADDLEHAAHHLARAIELGHDNDAVLDLVEVYARVAGADGLETVAIREDGMSHGRGALRAALLAHLGRWSEAIPLLMTIQAAVPEISYVDWLLDWLEDDAAVSGIDPDRFGACAMAVMSVASPQSEVAHSLLAALRALADFHSASEPLFLAHCRALSEKGDLAKALTLAQTRIDLKPTVNAYVALAGVHRRAGRLLEAIESFREASAIDPKNEAVLLDIGDSFLELGELEEALAAYRSAIEVAQNSDWGHASADFVNVLLDDDPDARARLLERASLDGASTRATELALRIAPFAHGLPPRPESCISLLRGGTQRDYTPVEIGISSLESPSAFACVRRFWPDVPIDAAVPAPDPREPLGRVPFVLWTFPRGGLLGWFGERSIEGVPAVPPPRAASVDAIAAFAARHFAPDTWWLEASSVARSIGPDAISEACAAMVHPPEVVGAHQVWDWMFRVQVASALVIARADDRWSGPRRDALTAIVRGPVDWVVTAALAAMTEIAIREPHNRTAVQEDFAMASAREPSPVVHMCISAPSVHLSLRMPDLPEALRAELVALRRAIEAPRRDERST